MKVETNFLGTCHLRLSLHTGIRVIEVKRRTQMAEQGGKAKT